MGEGKGRREVKYEWRRRSSKKHEGKRQDNKQWETVSPDYGWVDRYGITCELYIFSFASIIISLHIAIVHPDTALQVNTLWQENTTLLCAPVSHYTLGFYTYKWQSVVSAFVCLTKGAEHSFWVLFVQLFGNLTSGSVPAETSKWELRNSSFPIKMKYLLIIHFIWME